MRGKRKLLIVSLTVGLPILILTIVILYVFFADLSGWRDTVAEKISESLGREVRIEGSFEPDVGFTTSVSASDIILANAEWSSVPNMAAVERLGFEVDLLSLLFGPIQIHSLEIEGASVMLEVADDGSGNWEFDCEADDEPLNIRLGRLVVDQLQLRYSDAAANGPLDLFLAHLESIGDNEDIQELSLTGRFKEQDLEISGRLGALSGLLNLEAIEHDLSGHLGEIEFESAGRIAELETLGGVDLTARVHGPDLTAVGEIFDLGDVGSGPFDVNAGVQTAAEGYAINLNATAETITADITGSLDSLIEPGLLDVRMEASGADIAKLGALASIVDLPADQFSISGRVRWEGFPITCDTVEVRVGDNSLSAHGFIGEPPLMLGTDFTIDGQGPDISSIAALAGVNLPPDRFTVGGRLVRIKNGIDVEKLEARIGNNSFAVAGTVGDPPEYNGTKLRLHGEGPNLAYFRDLVDLDLPAENFEIDSTLSQGEGAINLNSVLARLGRNTLQVEGQLTTETQLAGTDLQLKASGPNASQLAKIADIPDVPAEAYSVEGRVRVLERGYRVSGLVGALGSLTARLDGFVAPPPTLVGSDLKIHVADSDLSHPASIAGITGLPREKLNVDTHVQIETSGYQLKSFNATVGDIKAEVSGLVGPAPDLEGTDLRIEVQGPRLAALGPYLEQPNLPSAPFSVSGGVRFVDASYVLDQIKVEIENNRAAVTGTVMPSNNFTGTDFEFDVSGPELREVGRLAAGYADLPEQPAEPYSITGKIKGTPERFAVRNFKASFGLSDLEGSFTIDTTGKPNVQARLTSTHLDLSHLRERLKNKDSETEDTAEPSAPKKSERLISDESLDLTILQKANADVEIRIDEIVLPINRLHDFGIDVRLEGGRLEIKRITAVGSDQGSVSGSLILQPGSEGHELRTRLEASQLRLDLPGSPLEPSEQPPVDISIDIQAHGATPHALASSSNGSFQVVIGKGVMDNRVVDLISADILLTLLSAFNPFAKDNVATEMQCGVVQVNIENGLATLEPMAFQSDKMTMLGKGRIDLGTEKLDLDWVTKPRKGIGISASMITNPYIKLGGTLNNPAIELKPMEAVTSTGVAVATMGLSLLAKGMYDRITAEKKVCKQALEQIGRQLDGTSKKSSKKRR